MSQRKQRGYALYENKRFDMAEREFRAALAEEPEDAYTHRMLALCIHNQHKFEAALSVAEDAVRFEPENAHGHYIVSVILDDLGRFRDAELAIDRAKKLSPLTSSYHTHDAYLAMQQGLHKEAIAKAQHALSLDPYDDQAIRVEAIATLNNGDRKAALAIAERALDVAPDSEHSHALMAAILKRDKKDFAKAITHYREALRINPGLTWAREGYMECLSARNPLYGFILGICWFADQPPRIVFGHPYAIIGSLLVWLILAITGAVLSQISSHLLTMYMRFDPLAVHALDPQEIRQSNILAVWIVSSMLISAGLLLVGFSPIFLPVVTLLYGGPLVFTRLFDLKNEVQQYEDYKKYCMVAGAFSIIAILCSFGPDTMKVNKLPFNAQDVSGILVTIVLFMCLFARRFPRVAVAPAPAPASKS